MAKWKTGKDALFLCENGDCVDIQIPEEAVEVTLELPVHRLSGCPRTYPTVNPPRLIRFRGYRRVFQSQQRLSPLPVTLGNIGYLTTDTAQTQ